MKIVEYSSDIKYPRDFVNKKIHGDCLNCLPKIPNNSIDLIITSPPYFVNKNYEKDWSFIKYSDLLQQVFKESFRILVPGKYFVINFGDYYNSNRFYESLIPSVFPATVNYFQWGRSVGFDLQATRIWRKQFSRMSIPFVCNSHPRPVFDYEHIWTFRKPNGTNIEFVNDRKKSQRAVLGDDWVSSARKGQHEAAFPIDLPLWAIDVYSQNKDEIVLDPFCGLGTTLEAAQYKERKFIGIEKNLINVN